MGSFFIDENVCLNYNYKQCSCRKCRDACPNGCWDAAGTAVPELCDRCGLCQAACPVDAVGVEGNSAFEWTGATANMGHECSFSCRKQGAGPWSCLGFLSARDLVALALAGDAGTGRDILVCDGACKSCKPSVAKHLEREIAAAAAFLAELGRGKILHGSAAGKQTAAAEKLDRRSFFASLLNTGMQTARNVIWPEDAKTLLRKADWRARVLPEIAVSSSEQDIFPVLSVDESCNACGLCARVCPTRAMKAAELAEGLALEHHPMACTDCGLCLEHCPETAITRLEKGPACSSVLIRQPFPRCNECGAAFQPAGRQLTCFDCLAKGSRSIFDP